METFQCPLSCRIVTNQMSTIWSPQRKFSTWRRLWVALAEVQSQLGLDIRQEQLDELRAHVNDPIDFDMAAHFESKLRHDVMAHLHTFGVIVPSARPILHLGATSQFVVCNTELLQWRDSFQLLISKMVLLIHEWTQFAIQWANVPTLGYTHLQTAQPTTVGKRAMMWCQDIVLALAEMEFRLSTLQWRGAKGATGNHPWLIQLLI